MTDRVLKRAPPSNTRTATSPSSSSRPPTRTSFWCSPTRARYKCKVAAFEDTKSRSWDRIWPRTSRWNPTRGVIWVIDPEDYKADVLFIFENGRARCASRLRVRHQDKPQAPQERHLRRVQAAVRPGAQEGPQRRAGLERLPPDELQHVAAPRPRRPPTRRASRPSRPRKAALNQTVSTAEEVLGGVSLRRKVHRAEPACAGTMKDDDMPSLFD